MMHNYFRSNIFGYDISKTMLCGMLVKWDKTSLQAKELHDTSAETNNRLAAITQEAE